MTTKSKQIEIDAISGLPMWPYRNRRRLEEQWLDALDRHGIGAFDVATADSSAELQTAVGQFNVGDFWECHETLEDVWRQTPYPFRFFYHPIIKTTVGFHHLSTHNSNGERVKLSDGIRQLKIFQPDWLGVRTDRLLADTIEWLPLFEAEVVDWAKLDGLPRPQVLIRGDQDIST